MGTESNSSRQLATLRELSLRVDSADGLAGLLGVAARAIVMEAGFTTAAVSLVRDGQYCETVAASGPDALRAALLGSRFTLASYEAEMAVAESWGVLCYLGIEDSTGVGVLHPAAAQLRDAMPPTSGVLYAPLNADTGELIGMISAEIAEGSVRPGIAAQRTLADVATIAANAIEKQTAPTVSVPEPAVDRSARADEPRVQPSVALEQLKDPDTGLPNREGLEEAFSATLQRLQQDGSTAAVLYCVLEEFDAIEETLGNKVAVGVLREISKRLQDSVRTYDVVGRVAPNTMAIVADHIAPGDTNSLVSRLRRSLAKIHIIDDEVIRIRGAVGVALVNNSTIDTSKVFRDAELAGEAARTGANSTYVLYSRYARGVH